MKALVITTTDPFYPMRGLEAVELNSPRKIIDVAPITRNPFICMRNGAAVMRARWKEEIADGDVIAFVSLPMGGGGRGGSNPLSFIAMIAVIWIAPYAAGGINSALGLGLGATGMTVLTSAVTVGLSAMVSALIPTPKLPASQQAAALAAPSPTYSLQSQGNYARLDSAIPVQYGRVKLFPDFGAQPYAEFQGNEQYLYQLFILGQGEFDLESINIEDTPISSWDDITYEVVQPYGTLTLFPASVTTNGEVSGQELMGARTATYTRSGTTVTVTETGHLHYVGQMIYFDATSGTAPDGEFVVASTPTVDTWTFTHTSSGTDTGQNCSIIAYTGPFNANAAGTDANYLGVDIILARGLYHYNTTTGAVESDTVSFNVDARPIDDAGNPTGGWVSLQGGGIVITAATTTPQRYSYRYPVAAGRWQVRMARTDAKLAGSEYGNDVIWGGLRGYLPDDGQFGNVTMLAMRMRASNNLSVQAARKINVIATRKIPTWNPSTGWGPNVATSSIAWALADALKASYGGGLADERIDLEGLYALDAIWSSRGDEFNARFDNIGILWEAITIIAQAGRAKPYIQGAIVYFARDAAATVPVALYSMRNIAMGSLSIEYIMPTEETANAVEVSYINSTTWSPERVTGYLAGTGTKPFKMSLFGVTNREQAFREALYYAATNVYRRRIIRFTTEMEGFIPRFGSLIAIQHDMPMWGQHAEAVAWDSSSMTLTLSEPLTFDVGNHYIGLRRKDGSLEGPILVTAGPSPNQIVLNVSPTFTPYTGNDYERTHVTFGLAETWRQPARVIAIRPVDLYRVAIEAVNEDDSVHTADQGVTAPPVQYSQLPTLYTAPVVAGLIGMSKPDDPSIMLLSWQQAPGAEYYIVEQSQDQTDWTRVAETRASNYTGIALYGSATVVRIAAVGLTKGPWVQWFYGLSSDYMWSTDATLMWDVDPNTLMWRY